ncbi:dolichyl-diphosphooligosaccharide-protein glycotransferase [Moniliophthora roreri MCA 2997]|uniref:Dolichyl-diphosphooligosaccharide-protein glycotransferase n=2 Tax=Moniliophthora roreri TaxID=221103 RepID=V2XWQ3_MONRO|nr:dolichyl-diphosphooligosaccharide-protein glycotransferase [Moniliophthora roreri MCA 2997]KAI3610808.1 dolichyl-diphosphooligosaccharide-protein glycotransferase [Moniliophthora roreri]
MKLWSFLPLVALPFASAASRDEARAKLVDLAAAGNGVIKLDSKSFDLLTSPRRNWSAAIQFTALDRRRRCAPCKEFEPSWNAVAQAWSSTSKEHRDNHFFGTLDFDEAPSVFQQLGLASAPVVYVYPAAEGPRQPASGKTSPSKYDFSTGFEAGPLAEHLSNHTPIPIPYKEPFDWAKLITGLAGLLAFAVTLRFISPILQSRWTWAAITVLTSLVMTGGYMFTRIRNVPYTGADGAWIAGGYQNQYGQEVQVVALVYGTLSFAFLMLIMIVPYQSSPSRQRLQVYLWSGVILLVYSVLVTLFRVKNRGYPFKLLL